MTHQMITMGQQQIRKLWAQPGEPRGLKSPFSQDSLAQKRELFYGDNN